MTTQTTRTTNGQQAAVVSCVAGLIALVLLILFFALAQPWRPGGSEFDWLGPANDAFVVVEFAALIPVALGLQARIGGRPVRWATAVGVAAMAGTVVLQLILIAGFISFESQVGPVMVGISVTFGWLFAVSHLGRRTLPRRLVQLGRAIGVSYLAGVGIFGAGLMLPAGSLGQWVVFGLGGVVGLFGWLWFPVWPLLLASHLSTDARKREER